MKIRLFQYQVGGRLLNLKWDKLCLIFWIHTTISTVTFTIVLGPSLVSTASAETFLVLGTVCYFILTVGIVLWNNIMRCIVRKRTSEMCAQRRLISACAWIESSLSAWRNFPPLAVWNVLNEDSDHTARIRRLIWIFAGCTVYRYVFSRFGSTTTIMIIIIIIIIMMMIIIIIIIIMPAFVCFCLDQYF